MSKLGALGIIAMLLIGGGIFWYFSTRVVDPDPPIALTFKISAIDQLAGSQEATTLDVYIYRLLDNNYVQQEKVDVDANQKETGTTYTEGEFVSFRLIDPTDTSMCTRYIKDWKVPKASWAEQNDGSFQITFYTVDRGDTAKDILIKYHNGTAIAASATLDVTNESWDSNYAEIDLEVRALDDDSGYWNTYNFLKGYDNNHYLVLKATGTGWDSVNLLTRTGWTIFDKASARYMVRQLSDSELSRDLQSGGAYDPSGSLKLDLTFDLTGFESGDSVTFTYEYRWYSSLDHFQDTSSWGTDTDATTETVTIQY